VALAEGVVGLLRKEIPEAGSTEEASKTKGEADIQACFFEFSLLLLVGVSEFFHEHIQSLGKF